MSKLDFPTILILAICIAAIVFLGYKMFEVYDKNQEPKTTPNIEITEEEEDPVNEDESDTYQYNIDDVDSTGITTTDDESNPGENETFEADNATSDDVPNSYDGSSTGRYMVLAGAFSIRENAEKYASVLQRRGYEDATAQLFDRGKLAVVLVDRFESLNDAKSLVQELKDKGVEAYVQTQRAGSN